MKKIDLKIPPLNIFRKENIKQNRLHVKFFALSQKRMKKTGTNYVSISFQ